MIFYTKDGHFDFCTWILLYKLEDCQIQTWEMTQLRLPTASSSILVIKAATWDQRDKYSGTQNHLQTCLIRITERPVQTPFVFKSMQSILTHSWTWELQDHPITVAQVVFLENQRAMASQHTTGILDFFYLKTSG